MHILQGEAELKQAQDTAKAAKLGIWSQPDPTPQEQWREENVED